MPSARLAIAATDEAPAAGSAFFGNLLQIVRHRAKVLGRCTRVERRNGNIRPDIGHRGKPVFEFRVGELRPAGLKIEEAENERPGKAEQRRREGLAHTGKRQGQTFLERGQHVASAVRACIKRLNDAADRADGADETPEGTEKTEEDEKADEVTRRITRFIEAGGDQLKYRV